MRPDTPGMYSKLKSISPATSETVPFEPITNWRGKNFSAKTDKTKFESFGFVLEFNEPYEADTLALSLRRHWQLPRPVVLEASEDGKTFEKVADVNFKSGDVLIKFSRQKG